MGQQPFARNLVKDFSSGIGKYAGASLLGGVNNLKPDTKTGTTNDTNTKQLTESAFTKAGASEAKAIDWSIPAISSIPQKTAESVKSGGEAVANGINNVKEKVSENVLQKVENYISGIGNSILHPGTPQNCQPAQTSSQASQKP